MIERNAINYLFTLPTILQALVEAPNYSPARMRSVETVYWGGAPIDAALYERLRREWPAKLGHIYGTTETMCALCNPRARRSSRPAAQAYGSRVRIGDLERLRAHRAPRAPKASCWSTPPPTPSSAATSTGPTPPPRSCAPAGT